MKAGRTNDPKGMREKIVAAAFALFTSRGFAATGMQDIRDAAQVSAGALAHHFATKKALALAVIEEKVRQAVEDTWIAPVAQARSAQEGIAAVFAQIAGEIEARGAVSGCPLNNLVIEFGAQDDEIRKALEAIFVAWEAALTGKFRGEGAGDAAARESAALVIVAYSGAMARAKARQDAAPLRLASRQIVDYLKSVA